MKRMSLALAFVALLSVELGCVASGAIATAPQSDSDDKVLLTQPSNDKDYTAPRVGMPNRTEGGGTR
ncbi:MAG: hypothetical protein WBA57_13710 [Elainellaceae cyanobacterium]